MPLISLKAEPSGSKWLLRLVVNITREGVSQKVCKGSSGFLGERGKRDEIRYFEQQRLTTWVYGERDDSLARQLAGKKDVGCLCLAVPTPSIVVFAAIEVDIVQSAGSDHVAIAGEVDYAGVLPSGLNLGVDERRKQEVAKVVGGELRLDVVLVSGEGDRHDAGIVDHDVEFRDALVDDFCSLADRIKVVELDRHEGGL